MEMKAYMEGIGRKWWLLLLVLVLSLIIGVDIGNNSTNQYTVSTSILLNDSLLANTAVPTNVMQIATPVEYVSKVMTPSLLSTISKHYPRLSVAQLQKDIVISTDSSKRFLQISMTDTSPKSAADIANFLAQQFIKSQSAELNRQIAYYENKFQQDIPKLNSDIANISLQITQLVPAPTQRGAVVTISPEVQRTVATDLYYLDQDERNLYDEQQALKAIQEMQPLFANAYVVLQPAAAAQALAVASLPVWAIELIAIGSGLFTIITLIILWDYFTPFVRYKGELQRLTGLSVSTEVPSTFNFEQKQSLQLRPLLLRQRINALRVLCASIGASALTKKGHTVLLTSPRKKYYFAAKMATFLARNGHQTLLIDADLEHPGLHQQLKLAEPCNLVTSTGRSLSFISKTTQQHLFLLPATALAINGHLSVVRLTELLPELQSTFSVIIIDASPLDHANTHLLSKYAAQTLLLMKKRRESLKTLKMAHAVCQELKLDIRCVVLS